MKPLVTIVTPTLRMGRFLQCAADSVLNQDYDEIQYIVVDGGSTDETIEVLRGYGERLQWCSEPDNGPADAIRKGFEAAEGEVFAWLNADDEYLPGTVRAAVEALQRDPEILGVYSGARWLDAAGSPIGPYPVRNFDTGLLSRECIICQPACFFRAAAFRKAGGLDVNWRTAFDWDLWIRFSRIGRMRRVDGEWARVRMHRDSLTLGQRRVVLEEGARLLARHYGYVPFDWIYARLCHEQDGRDQFYEPLRPSVRAWVRSLGVGWRANREQRGRFVAEWAKAATPGGAFRQMGRTIKPPS